MKPDIGIISKKVLDNINDNISFKIILNQWKNSYEVIN